MPSPTPAPSSYILSEVKNILEKILQDAENRKDNAKEEI